MLQPIPFQLCAAEPLLLAVDLNVALRTAEPALFYQAVVAAVHPMPSLLGVNVQKCVPEESIIFDARVLDVSIFQRAFWTYHFSNVRFGRNVAFWT